MKLTILDGSALNPGDLSWDLFKKYADIIVYSQTNENDVISHIGTSDAILLNKVVISNEIISRCKNLKYIGVLATGYNVIDIKAAKNAKICITNIPAYSTMAVAQHVFSLITYFSNHVAIHSSSVMNGDWIKSQNFCYWNKPLIELAGKTIGIIGYGNIGKQVEKIALAFGMKVIVCPHKMTSNIKNAVTLETLLKTSNFITLHTPLTDETKDLINKESINQMKKGVYIINTARGGLIKEQDVKIALESGKINGYACDVLNEEPMSKDCPLLNVQNCIITPHIAWAPLETRSRLMNIAFDNFESWVKGTPKNVI